MKVEAFIFVKRMSPKYFKELKNKNIPGRVEQSIQRQRQTKEGVFWDSIGSCPYLMNGVRSSEISR